jgi:hypothetical protein
VIAGMDHATNAALYRLKWRVGKLQFVGDARSASEAVKNWRPSETAQKFQTRPTLAQGQNFRCNDRSLDPG